MPAWLLRGSVQGMGSSSAQSTLNTPAPGFQRERRRTFDDAIRSWRRLRFYMHGEATSSVRGDVVEEIGVDLPDLVDDLGPKVVGDVLDNLVVSEMRRDQFERAFLL